MKTKSPPKNKLPKPIRASDLNHPSWRSKDHLDWKAGAALRERGVNTTLRQELMEYDGGPEKDLLVSAIDDTISLFNLDDSEGA